MGASGRAGQPARFAPGIRPATAKRRVYEVNRLTHRFETLVKGAEILVERIVYGEAHPRGDA